MQLTKATAFAILTPPPNFSGCLVFVRCARWIALALAYRGRKPATPPLR
jgi:hypothetical protein